MKSYVNENVCSFTTLRQGQKSMLILLYKYILYSFLKKPASILRCERYGLYIFIKSVFPNFIFRDCVITSNNCDVNDECFVL